MSVEEWRPVTGFEGLYEVPNNGRVRSLDRLRKGRWGSKRKVPGKVLTGNTSGSGHVRVQLYDRTGTARKKLVHRLVAQEFLENREGKKMVLHWDDNPTNNNLGNLRWGTHKDNMKDMIRNGNHVESRKTECPKGHPYDEENTSKNGKGHRRCLTCREERRTLGLPEGDPRHGTHNGFYNLGCRCEPCNQAGPYPKRRSKNVKP